MDRTRIELAEDVLGVGDVESALRILDAHLARHPDDADAKALRESALAMRLPATRTHEDFGELRPDARHLEPPPRPPPAATPPLGVALLAGFHMVVSVVVSIFGFAILLAAPPLGFLVLLACVPLFGLAVGLWRLRGWAWILALLFYIVGAIVSVARFGQGEVTAIVGILFNGGIAAYLIRVGRAFASPARSAQRTAEPS